MKVLVLLIVGAVCAQAIPFAVPESCDETKCKRPDCVCSSTTSPVANPPQLVTLTFDESVTDAIYSIYYQPILFHRRNPDGNPISATFFVPHVYSDYEMVNRLYNAGFEIATHSISKNVLQSYWSQANLETLVKEFKGERELISKFANIPITSIQGARSPHFQYSGDNSFEAYKDAGIAYDNSWTSYSSQPLFPYTFEYRSTQSCVIWPCPESSFPGQWILPIVNFRNKQNHECNVLVACNVNGTANQQFQWLREQFLKIYTTNKAPINLLVSSSWFTFLQNSEEAYKMFLDYLGTLSDVYLVSSNQVMNWAKNPVTASQFSSAQTIPATTCAPRVCALRHESEMRYMKSCVACPNSYPWLDDPLGATPPPPAQ